MKYTLLLSFLISLGIQNLNAQKEVFEKGNASYEAGAFDQAIESYEASLTAGHASDELYYNLGNAYYQNNNLGKAILNYERALKISPRFKDARFNLDIAKSKIKNDIPTLPPFFLSKWLLSIRNQFSSTGWGILFILFLLAATAVFGIWILAKERQKKKKGFIAIFPLLTLAIAFFIFGYSKLNFERNSGEAILMSAQISLKQAPDQLSDNVIDLFEGIKVKVVQELGDWLEVELPDKERGWIEKGVIEFI